MSGGMHQASGRMQAAKRELQTSDAGVNRKGLGIDPRRRDLASKIETQNSGQKNRIEATRAQSR
jgi:hypothetical protein